MSLCLRLNIAINLHSTELECRWKQFWFPRTLSRWFQVMRYIEKKNGKQFHKYSSSSSPWSLSWLVATVIFIEIRWRHTLQTQDVNWTHIRRSEDAMDVFWTSFVCLIYSLCLRGHSVKHKSIYTNKNHLINPAKHVYKSS